MIHRWATAIFFIFVSVVILSAFFAAAEMAMIAGFSLLSFFALILAWVRFPHGLRMFMTNTLVALGLSGYFWYLGWKVLPDSGTMKMSFVMVHILVDLGMIFEHKRMRGKLWYQRRQKEKEYNPWNS